MLIQLLSVECGLRNRAFVLTRKPHKGVKGKQPTCPFSLTIPKDWCSDQHEICCFFCVDAVGSGNCVGP